MPYCEKNKRSFIATVFAVLVFLTVIAASNTVFAENKITQTGVGTTWAEISWTTPASEKNGDIEWYKIEWGLDSSYDKYHVVDGYTNKYRITGLMEDTSYDVKITYKYMQEMNGANPDGGAFHTLEYGTIQVVTGLRPMTSKEDWKYIWTGGGVFQMTVPHVSGDYQLILGKGPTVKLPSWNISDIYNLAETTVENNQKYMTLPGKNSFEVAFTKEIKNQGVITIGIRPVRYRALTIYGKAPDGHNMSLEATIAGGWQTKTCVPDPYFTAKRVKVKKKDGIKVTIKPVKYAQTYTIYIGRYAGEKKNGYPKIKGLKKVKTVQAVSGKKVKVTVTKYNKKAINFSKYNYVVQVVNNSRYGTSTRYTYAIVW